MVEINKDYKLNLGANLFHYSGEEWRDFYFKIAEESCYDMVGVGEVVCSKRYPSFAKYIPEVIKRLKNCGKQPLLSTLALSISNGEVKNTRRLINQAREWKVAIEINDVSGLVLISEGSPKFVISPFVNVYNEYTFEFFAKNNAILVSLAGELDRNVIEQIGKYSLLNSDYNTELEVTVFGRLPLAIATRCYHARHYKVSKDACQYVCVRDPDGLEVNTLDDQPFLAVNGLQTMSHTCVNLLGELNDLKKMNINNFRVSPQSCDMVAVGQIYRDCLDDKISSAEAISKLSELISLEFSNGFYYGEAGIDKISELKNF